MKWWTESEDSILRSHWGNGRTAAEIGQMIGRSKGQVIGRAHRLELKSLKVERVDNAPTRKRRKRKIVVLPKGKRRFCDGVQGCQWLNGEPRERRFCGAPTVQGSSFCAHHHGIVWIKHEDYRSEAA